MNQMQIVPSKVQVGDAVSVEKEKAEAEYLILWREKEYVLAAGLDENNNVIGEYCFFRVEEYLQEETPRDLASVKATLKLIGERMELELNSGGYDGFEDEFVDHVQEAIEVIKGNF